MTHRLTAADGMTWAPADGEFLDLEQLAMALLTADGPVVGWLGLRADRFRGRTSPMSDGAERFITVCGLIAIVLFAINWIRIPPRAESSPSNRQVVPGRHG